MVDVPLDRPARLDWKSRVWIVRPRVVVDGALPALVVLPPVGRPRELRDVPRVEP